MVAEVYKLLLPTQKSQQLKTLLSSSQCRRVPDAEAHASEIFSFARQGRVHIPRCVDIATQIESTTPRCFVIAMRERIHDPRRISSLRGQNEFTSHGQFRHCEAVYKMILVINTVGRRKLKTKIKPVTTFSQKPKRL